ncbi:biotin--[acetyl-CoA-carboxylase] ligase [Ichthyenterobacterium magnum]|uniref:BirA family biotin operon repressor/biotin-[acetyl-CoA-carboxylase] ligase n=1 Tax=Ichthyenterobacterium magnum TaxID=1230530 RepID=A0A420DET5_9FLAO|nr:biotin--[acetyl-CoA-carboxylase] ligase [Ichthyenterobacterium magnum]RKE90915.1 BirA family biotin operon repressor/biotin-[acetyl-CoA-carboxylase] ligase [Ichthyenterobacterium magnum]
MHIIKLNAIDSTNSYLRALSTNVPLDDYTVVVAKHQTNGRGQMGTHWQSQDSKNLMVSVFKDVSFLDVDYHFYISIVVSLSIYDTLKSFNIKKLKVKWPNDILSEDKKIAGVLIENVIKQNQMQGSIIGFGINVNQKEFTNLPNASSLHLISGKLFDLDEVLHLVLSKMKYYFFLLKEGEFDILISTYQDHLFRKNKPSTFKNTEGVLFSGFIEGVSNSGNLQIRLEDDIIKEFDLKEVTLLY